ncbi:MAG TPA: ATP-dependent Clp protease ATP-binding subunit ClpX [Polyangia bacterium]|nr:ATP-dependent Clp protease ATP-binding subunit ClpX [Polyangia bacterium]
MKRASHSLVPSDRPARTPREIFAWLDSYVIGQTRAKRAVAIAAYNHQKRCAQPKGRGKKLIRKSNLLLIGPTGCGKTHLARNLADCLQVPFTVVDATEYTEAGYYGKDVEVMIAELLFKANHSLEDTQRGIVFLDEIDKIARRSQGARNGAGSRDIGGEGVQQAMLKLLEGREIFVPLNVTQHWNKHDFVQVDTSDILFIAAGTFSDLPARADDKKIGFDESANGARKTRRRRIGQKELIEYGMLAELLGRLPVVVELDALDEEQLLEVLTGPPDSLVREYTALLQLDDVKLDFEDEALRRVVRYATSRRIGARGLRAILEEVCADVMFEAPERRGETVVVSDRYVRERLEALDEVSLGEG